MDYLSLAMHGRWQFSFLSCLAGPTGQDRIPFGPLAAK